MPRAPKKPEPIDKRLKPAEKALAARPAKAELIPALSTLPTPHSLESIADVRAEYQRLYRFIFQGKLKLEDATKLFYLLDRMIAAKKAETELDELAKAYAKSWGGIRIIVPSEEVIDA